MLDQKVKEFLERPIEFDVLAKARNLDDLRMIETIAREVREKNIRELEDADVRELAIHGEQDEPDISE